MQPHEIRAALVLARVTITSIARDLGVKPPTVHAVITGKRPTPRIRQAIAEAIGRPVEEVFPTSRRRQKEVQP